MANFNDFRVKHGLVVATTATIQSTSQSVSTTTGALQVAGGAGIGGNLHVGGIVTATTFVGNLTGNVTGNLTGTANLATTSTNLAGGAAGSIPIQVSPSVTAFVPLGTSGHVLTAGTNTATWTAVSGLSAGTAITATNITITNDVASSTNHYITFVSTSTGNTGVKSGAENGLVYIPSSRYLGIATATVTNFLQVGDPNGLGYGVAVRNNNGYIFLGQLLSTASTVADAFTIMYSDTGQHLFRIQNTGDVGIGTGAPNAKLHVVGGAIITGVTTVTNTTAASSTITGAFQVAGGAGIGGGLVVGGIVTATNVIRVGPNSNLYIANGIVSQSGGNLNLQSGGLSQSFTHGGIQLNNNGGTSIWGGNSTLSTGTSAGLWLAGGYGEVYVSKSSVATSTTSGAFQVVGGVGIGGNIYVGGNSNIAGNGVITGTLQVNSGNANTGTNTSNALYTQGGAWIDKTLVVGGDATFRGSVSFQGTNTFVYSSSTVYTDNILSLHAPFGSTPGNHTWTVDDGRDIGFLFHYYKGADLDAFLGFDNTTQDLEWFSNGAESGGVYTGTTYGRFRTGSIRLLGGTANGSNTSTGDLAVLGGVGIGGGLFVGGTVTATNFVGAFSGSIAGAATQVNTVAQLTNATYFPTFVDSNNASATGELVYTTSSFSINPSTRVLTAANIRTPASEIALGDSAGGTSQGTQAIAIGFGAGINQGVTAVAIGSGAGNASQSGAAIAIGQNAGQTSQGVGAVAIGLSAGSASQGNYSLALGFNAGFSSQVANSIILSAGGVAAAVTTATNAGLYISPIRSDVSTSATTYAVYYNPTTKEVTTSTAATGGSSTGTTSTFVISNTTAATSTQTGALQVAGGAGIGGDLHVGGAVYTSGARILPTSIQEFTATGGQTTFTVAGGYTVGTIQVIANGIQLANADFTASNGTTVVVAVPRISGDIIRTISGLTSSSVNNINSLAIAYSVAFGG